jgi:hypothetical protein
MRWYVPWVRYAFVAILAGLLMGSAPVTQAAATDNTGGVVTNDTGTGINAPYGITAGPDGNLWFTNLGNDSIGRITTTSATAPLSIAKAAGTPGPPQNVTVLPENGYAELQWQPPPDPGTPPITGYVITATPYANSDYFANSQVVSTSGPGTGTGPQNGRIEGLLEDCHQEYTFTVSAVNAAGTGPPSADGTGLLPNRPSPPDATNFPPHFRASGIVAQADNERPVVVVTVDGFGSEYYLGSNGNPKSTTINPLVGVNISGVQQIDSSGNGLPVSYCAEGEQSAPNANSSAPDALWGTDLHFDTPELDPGFVKNGQYVKTHHYLLDHLVEGGGVIESGFWCPSASNRD